MLLLPTAILAFLAAQTAAIEVHTREAWGQAPMLLACEEMSADSWSEYFSDSPPVDWLELVFPAQFSVPADGDSALYLTDGSILLGHPAAPSSPDRFAWATSGGTVIEVAPEFVWSVAPYAQLSHQRSSRDELQLTSSGNAPDFVSGWFLSSTIDEVSFDVSKKEVSFPWSRILRMDLVADAPEFHAPFFVHFKDGNRLAVDAIEPLPNGLAHTLSLLWRFRASAGFTLSSEIDSIALIEHRFHKKSPRTKGIDSALPILAEGEIDSVSLWPNRVGFSTTGHPLVPGDLPASLGLGCHLPLDVSFAGREEDSVLFLRLGLSAKGLGRARFQGAQLFVVAGQGAKERLVGAVPASGSARYQIELPAHVECRFILKGKGQSWAGANVDLSFLGWGEIVND